ncbi:DNA polymerase III subunit epsilon [Methyloceanibacter stevinii]|uniref:DNA polymerase III subunit epsilon n=1 Tax=Methyloceanibacter stevinii TaxID=1774970 RepID=A0A1E3VRB3_9HYPH|nr:DNA polymerase III subunit epsilon [Methyloceanibacter stevinii]ODR95821.1 DNA polymerase III subunit epsilon [Methyloceanibacter stevinii]
MREIILDTETTGLDPKEGHRIVEIGCVELVNSIPTGRTWHCYLNPERDMPEQAFAVHGLSTEFLGDKPLFADKADEFLEFVESAMLVIHNAKFDFGFLNAELEWASKPLLTWDRIVDTLALARRRHPGSPASLDALCRRYGIDLSGRDLHGALLDCRLLAGAMWSWSAVSRRGWSWPETGAQQADTSGNAVTVTPRAAPLPSRLTAEEREAHRVFVATLGEDAIWRRYE